LFGDQDFRYIDDEGNDVTDFPIDAVRTEKSDLIVTPWTITKGLIISILAFMWFISLGVSAYMVYVQYFLHPLSEDIPFIQSVFFVVGVISWGIICFMVIGFILVSILYFMTETVIYRREG